MTEKPKTTLDDIEAELKRAEDLLGQAHPRFAALTDALGRIGRRLYRLVKWVLPVAVAMLPPFLIHLNAVLGRPRAPLLYGMRAAAAACIWVGMLSLAAVCWPEQNDKQPEADALYALLWLVGAGFSLVTIVVAYAPV